MFEFSKWLYGMVSLEISGFGKERLINVCKKNNIELFDLTHNNDNIVFSVITKDYKKLNSYNEKIKTNIKILNKSGLPHFLYRYKKRKIFLLCFLMFVCSLFLLSNFIWNITITGNNSYTDIEIIKDVEQNYVKIGTPKSKINCSELEKKLRNKYDKIAWISCELKGTNLIINVEETLSKEPVIKEKTPCNIIAYKDAIITDVIINNGQKIVNVGEEVKRNDILITGVVNIYNEYNELIETNYTTSAGTIYGIVEYSYYDVIEMQKSKKIYTDNHKKSYSIELFNNVFMLPSGNIKYDNYDIITENDKLKLFEHFYLPFSISKNTYKEYTTQVVSLEEGDAKKQAREKLVLYIDNLKKKGVSILENNVTIDIVDGKCVASGTIKCKEIIGIPSPIDSTDLSDNISYQGTMNE